MAKKSEIMRNLIRFIGDRGFVTVYEIQEEAASMIDPVQTLVDHGLVFSNTATAGIGGPTEFTLSRHGRAIYEQKHNAPYAEMLDGDIEIGRKAVEAAMQSVHDLGEHDPERAKALLKQILGEELYAGVRLTQYKPLYPIFNLDGIEFTFVQGASPQSDHLLIDGMVAVRDLASLGQAIKDNFSDDDDDDIFWSDDDDDQE
jgi:hypothetical protein